MSLANQGREDLLNRLRSLFVPMMRTLHENGGAQFSVKVLADPAVQEFIGAHADVLDSGFERASMSDAMRSRLQRSDYIFSGMKTFHELNEAFPSLLDENGNRKPFEQFLNEVRSIDQTYNEHYLRAEYNFVQSSAEMASKWERFMEDGDRYHLQYRTAKDDKVRPEHAALDGVTLPPSDPFWAEYYPPNGWNCRCTVVQVRKSKYPATSHDEAMSRGADALQKDSKGIFRFNPGIERKAMPDYNPYTIRRCRDCDIAKGKTSLARPLNCDLCQACRVLNGLVDDMTERIKDRKRRHKEFEHDDNYRDVKIDKKTGGLKATHTGHITHSNEKEEVFFGRYTSTDLESRCQDQLFRMGHEAILCDESKRRPDGNLYTALDLCLDGEYMDIRSVTSAHMYGNILIQKNKQLRKYNQRPDIDKRADSVCLYFERPGMFTDKKMRSSINYFKYFRDNNGNLLERELRHVYVVIKGESQIRKYDI